MDTPEYKPVKAVIDEANFCCGYKKCPVVRLYEDGSATVDDNDQHIEFTADQMAGLRAMLSKTPQPKKEGAL